MHQRGIWPTFPALSFPALSNVRMAMNEAVSLGTTRPVPTSEAGASVHEGTIDQ
jgi:hypothetical protein